jgi:hypothetical protein
LFGKPRVLERLLRRHSSLRIVPVSTIREDKKEMRNYRISAYPMGRKYDERH